MPHASLPTMRAAFFDGALRVIPDYPRPKAPPGWALLRVRLAGVCQTDMELMRGYMAFRGVLGHECVATVEQCEEPAWQGKRVAPEINAACGSCPSCAAGLARHCPNRAVLGILNLDGCMADYCAVPVANLVEIPDDVPDDRAVLVEPLSAACEILEQIPLSGSERAVVLGDGRLGILAAWALATVLTDVTLVGRHEEKLEKARWGGLATTTDAAGVPAGADLVVEATGSSDALATAMALCRPRGTIALKSTVASPGRVDLSPLVINEQTLVGSRCGRFRDGLRMMRDHPDMPLERLISARYPLERAAEAFQTAAQPGTLKVLLET